MKNIYRQAAELIFYGNYRFCCNVLKHKPTAIKLFTEWFKDQHSPLFGYFPGMSGPMSHAWFGDELNDENQLARQLALLFMEQIEKDEKRSKKSYKQRKIKALQDKDYE